MYPLRNIKKSVNVWLMGHLQYQPAYCVQQFLASRLAARSSPNMDTLDTLLIVEHAPGKNILFD